MGTVPILARVRAAVAAALIALLWLAVPSSAQTLPALTGRIVDQANLLPPDREASLSQQLEALERASSRQLVVVTVPNLQGLEEEEFAYRLGTAWKLGDERADNGAILLIAVAERKIRIEVGDGLEPILTDAMSWIIIRDQIQPRFRQSPPDYAGGITAGTLAIVQQLGAPPEEAERRAVAAAARQRQVQQQGRRSGGGGGSIFPALFWIVILIFVIVPMLRRFGGRSYGRRYGSGDGRRRRGFGGGGPIVIWGGGGSGWSGGGGGGWGGGGGGGGFGGFSGGGGSFGGGGASGGW